MQLIYQKQYVDNAAKYKTAKSLTEEEYLSKMKKDDRLVPVITVVVYYGEKPWDGAVSLHGMLHISEEMKPFVNDYRMHLVEARKNDLKLHNINNRDLFNLLGILLDRNGKLQETRDRAINYAREHRVEKTVIMTAAGAANCKIDYNKIARKGGADMCTVFEETRREGIAEGEAKGIIETGYEFGISEEEILARLQKKLNISLAEAQEYVKKFGRKNKSEYSDAEENG